jgi:hypothetical protein
VYNVFHVPTVSKDRGVDPLPGFRLPVLHAGTIGFLRFGIRVFSLKNLKSSNENRGFGAGTRGTPTWPSKRSGDRLDPARDALPAIAGLAQNCLLSCAFGTIRSRISERERIGYEDSVKKAVAGRRRHGHPALHPVPLPVGAQEIVMKLRNLFFATLMCPPALVAGQGQTTATDIPHLRKQGTATQLIVDGKPFLALAGEPPPASST